MSVDGGGVVLITRPCYGSFDPGLATNIETNGSSTVNEVDCSGRPPAFDVEVNFNEQAG